MAKQPNIIPVILCGGVGSRLWPVSRAEHPKFFIKLNDNRSFLQRTLLRALNLSQINDVITVSNKELVFKIKSEYQEISADFPPNTHTHYILEPFGRNTAPAMVLASLKAHAHFDEDAVLLVLPADHLISDIDKFKEAVLQACELAAQDKLVTFGIPPTRPETGYGYIEHDAECVKQFVEKPDRKTAINYIKAGNFLWNSGMFCFKAKTLLDEMALHAPDILNETKETLRHSTDTVVNKQFEVDLNPTYFKRVPDNSIDYALMEKSNKVAVVKTPIHWQDIGCWHAYGEMTPPR
jgi:mannose-1-phosphate guanylyltransferase